MQVVLVMFKADGERRSFSLPRDVTVIGRREDCDLRIPLSDVSRKHCRLIKDGDTLRLEDLGSSNGTFHNQVRIQEAIVQPGDAIQIGPVAFAVQVDGVPDEDQIVPPQAVATRPTEQPQEYGEEAVGYAPAADFSGIDSELAPPAGEVAEFTPLEEEPSFDDEPLTVEAEAPAAPTEGGDAAALDEFPDLPTDEASANGDGTPEPAVSESNGTAVGENHDDFLAGLGVGEPIVAAPEGDDIIDFDPLEMAEAEDTPANDRISLDAPDDKPRKRGK